MFRDLKEYQEIAKIYADKVSKPENLEERRGASPEQLAANRKDAFKGVPNSASNKRAEMSKARRGDKKFEFKKPTGGAQGRTKRPEVKKEPEYKPEKGVVFGQRTNEVGAQGGGKPSEGDFKKDFPDKKPEIKKEKPKMGSPDSKFIKKERGKGPGFVKRGTPTAQRAENQEKARNRAKEMAKARLAKKAEMANEENKMPNAEIKASKLPINKDKNFKTGYTSTSADGLPIQNFGDPKDTTGYYSDSLGRATKFKNRPIIPNPFEKKDKKNIKSSYEYDAYDLVLEYLLSSEQVATIEEANYVMTEMDAETIQSIVEAQKKTS